MALPNRMSLRPGLLWLTLNLATIIQCLSRNNSSFPHFYITRKMFSPTQVEDHRINWRFAGITASELPSKQQPVNMK
jgi:hypothetical protein